jgi:hypothetical protein
MPYDPKTAALVQKVLGNPESFPDEFKGWLSQQINSDTNLKIGPSQLTAPETPQKITGGIGFANAWVDSGAPWLTAQFWKDPWRIVHVEGIVKNGTLGAAAFTLPAGYRPVADQLFPAIDGAGAVGYVIVTAAGVVTPNGGSNVSFSISLHFRAL